MPDHQLSQSVRQERHLASSSQQSFTSTSEITSTNSTSGFGVIGSAHLNEPGTSAASPSISVFAPSKPLSARISAPEFQRKRSRCDSDPQDVAEELRLPRPPEKMYKSYDDVDTDTEMEGLVCEGSTDSSPSASPTQRSSMLTNKLSSNAEGKRKGSDVLPPPVVANKNHVQIEKREFTTRKRDEQFYLEDGSCVFLVEDTLFNVSSDSIGR